MDATKGTDNKIKCLRTDQAGEHLSKQYQTELKRQEIRMECSCAYDHWQNGYAKKLIRDICNMARCMLEYGKVARDMWGYAVRYAAHIQNRIVHAGMPMSPYEMRHGEAPHLNRLRVFGCTAYVTRDKKETDFVKDKKLDVRGAEGCFVGIAKEGIEIQGAAVKGYLVWTLETGASVIASMQVKFDETRYPKLMGVTEWEFSLQAKVEKCKATITVMSFETEHIDHHQFVFDTDEIQYREEQMRTKLDPQKLIGVNITVTHGGQQRTGKIYNYVGAYKVWGIVLHQATEDEACILYVTAEQMADENKVVFNEKLAVFRKKQLPKLGKEITTDGGNLENTTVIARQDSDDVSLFSLKLKEEIDLL